jgi:hypothetical protein
MDNKLRNANQFVLSQKAGYIYILMDWRSNKPIEAVYTSRSFSYKRLQDEIDTLLSQQKKQPIIYCLIGISCIFVIG